ncbi:reverse transcriptase domain-containing protein [Tanacetum coccineum]
MRTRSSSNLIAESSTTPKRRNRRRSKQRVEPFSLEESPVVTMAITFSAKFSKHPLRVHGDAIVLFLKEEQHAHIRWFNKITSIIKYRDVPNSFIKISFFHFFYRGGRSLDLAEKEPCSILTWEDLVSKFINQFFPPSKTTNLRNEITNFQQRFDESFCEVWDHFKDLLRACSHHGFTKLHQLDTFYNALTPTDQDSLNAAAGGNLLTKTPLHVVTDIEEKYKNQVKTDKTEHEMEKREKPKSKSKSTRQSQSQRRSRN